MERTTPHAADHIIDGIPPPDAIRRSLADLFARARILRGLLRLAESKERQISAARPTPARRPEVCHAN